MGSKVKCKGLTCSLLKCCEVHAVESDVHPWRVMKITLEWALCIVYVSVLLLK